MLARNEVFKCSEISVSPKRRMSYGWLAERLCVTALLAFIRRIHSYNAYLKIMMAVNENCSLNIMEPIPSQPGVRTAEMRVAYFEPACQTL